MRKNTMAKNENLGVNCVHVIPPDPMSEPCSRFFHHHEELCGFFLFAIHLAVQRDEGAKIAAEALYDTSSDEEEKTRLKETIERGVGAIKTLRRYRQFIYQTMVYRAVDNFLTYLAELLALIFRTRPETLKSSETVRLDELLQHSSMEDLINFLAENRMEKLSYQGMRELCSYLDEKLGLKLFDSNDDLQRAVFLVEVRNIIVHNRGVVNRIFKSRVPWFEAEMGESINLKFDDVFSHLAFLAKSLRQVDQRASEKFALPLPISLDKFKHDMKDKVLD